MPLERGAVYRHPIRVLGPRAVGEAVEEKLIIVLQDPTQMDPNASSFAFVVCSTEHPDGVDQGWKVVFQPADLPGAFDRATEVDGRWVYTLERDQLEDSPYLGTLDDDQMEDVTVAVVSGLQLMPALMVPL